MRPGYWLKSLVSPSRPSVLRRMANIGRAAQSSRRRAAASTLPTKVAECLEQRTLLTPMTTMSGDLNLTSADTFTVEIEGAVAGTGHDQTVVTGGVNLGAATLDLQTIPAATVGFGDQLTIIDNDGSDPVTEMFAGLVEGAPVDVGGRTSTISYIGGDGNDVVITVGAFVVDSTTDEADGDLSDGDVSLRDALIAANQAGGTADRISVSTGSYTLSLTGRLENAAATGDLDIAQDVTIVGGSGTSSETVIDADSIDRVFHILDNSLTVRVENLTVTGGNATDDGTSTSSGKGGGFLVEKASLTLVNVAITNNSADDIGGALLARGDSFPLSSGVSLSGNTDGGVINNQFELEAIETVSLVAGDGAAVVSVGETLTITQGDNTLLEVPRDAFIELEIIGTGDPAGDTVLIASNAASSLNESILVTAGSSGDLVVRPDDEFTTASRDASGVLEFFSTASTAGFIPDISLTGIDDLILNTRAGDDSVQVEGLDSLATPLDRLAVLLGSGADTFIANDAFNSSTGTGVTVNGNGGLDTLVGSDRSDQIVGSSSHDLLLGRDGDDTINAQAGDDVVFGGDGNDHLLGGAGADDLDGNEGDDAIVGQGGYDTVRGGTGIDRLVGGRSFTVLHDTIDGDVVVDRNGYTTARGDRASATHLVVAVLQGGAGDDVFEVRSTITQVGFLGGDGNDTLIGAGLDDTLEGQAGDDSLIGNLGQDSLSGGEGNDVLRGQTDDDTLFGGAGNDLLDGGNGINSLREEADADLTVSGSGSSVILTGAGSDTLVGAFGSAMLIGGSSDNRLDASGFNGSVSLFGEAGDDTLVGTVGDDVIDGGAGNDSLTGGRGFDRIDGEDGNDTINGGLDPDTLLGGTGDDSIRGSTGTDRLLGEEGSDTLDGESGRDRIAEGGNKTATSPGDVVIDEVFLVRETLLFNFDTLVRRIR